MRWVWAVMTLLSAIITLGFTAIWFARTRLPYNEEGNYFDAASSVVLHEQAVTVYAILALAAATVTLAVALVTRRSWRRHKD